MDLAFWGFRHWPFDRTFSADRFYASQQHDEALARMLFLVEESRRCGIVSGPGGTGKSFLLKLLQNRTERLGRITIRCDATGLDGNQLLGQIAQSCQTAVDIDAPPARIWNSLRARFAALGLIRQPMVILIDHFDLVEPSCQQAIWRLHQLADAVGLKLTILLATREQQITGPLQELVELRIEINAWSPADTALFINRAVHHAGCGQALFSDDAVRMIHHLTKGVPWAICCLTSHCLLAARSQDQTHVTHECVEAVVAELWPQQMSPTQHKPGLRRDHRHSIRHATYAALTR
ncbi:AAA family ATPase [Schlesneria sp. DSM 10557]|uniref:AAA family ATPase n=1 Tax=Schlesneria sp. DSM 10557 TaxID=3044399 RepID=UPI0035A0DDA1